LLRNSEPQPKFTLSYKKKLSVCAHLAASPALGQARAGAAGSPAG